jgi:hypothetical protein
MTVPYGYRRSDPPPLADVGRVRRAGHADAPVLCPDCAVPPGVAHVPGCDVARCTVCGMQALFHAEHDPGHQVWTGRWPGEEEVDEGLASDLNDLYRRAARGDIVWSQERSRFVAPAAPAPCPRCHGERLVERSATPAEVDAGCELGVAYDRCPDCTLVLPYQRQSITEPEGGPLKIIADRLEAERHEGDESEWPLPCGVCESDAEAILEALAAAGYSFTHVPQPEGVVLADPPLGPGAGARGDRP